MILARPSASARRACLASSAACLTLAPAAHAFPDYLDAFQARYPSSTIPLRMQNVAGMSCATCHHPPILGDIGTCYREDLKIALESTFSISEALRRLESIDSDGDGVPNRYEILAPRTDLPGQVGYHAGLRGPTGIDQCHPPAPTAPVTNQDETAPFCRANCDGSTTGPALTPADFVCFLELYRTTAALDPRLVAKSYANCDGSTGTPALTPADFVCFLNAYRAGC